MGQTKLFDDEPHPNPAPSAPAEKGAPRLREANRSQVVLQPVDLDSLLTPDHPARTLWTAVGQLDLRGFYEPIEARDGVAGRNATDPKILVCLWLYATAEGIGAARELDRLCREHIAYRWICGGVSVNYHLLAEFRVGHMVALDQLLTDVIGRLLDKGLITMRCVAHDGMRIRASAGAASFRRKSSLRRALRDAQRQVEACKAEFDDPKALDQRRTAEQRTAEQKRARLEEALDELKAIEKAKTKDPNRARRAKEPRVSSTDPEARVMKMPDGGFRPGYNVQLSTDVASRMIVGVRVSNVGSDSGQLSNALDEIQQRIGTVPDELLVDAGFVNFEAIESAANRDVTIYAPVPKRTDDPHARNAGDSDVIAEWRERMDTDEAKEIYKQRASTAETTNADLKEHRGLDSVNVRGITKVLSVTLWAALAYNLLRTPLDLLTS